MYDVRNLAKSHGEFLLKVTHSEVGRADNFFASGGLSSTSVLRHFVIKIDLGWEIASKLQMDRRHCLPPNHPLERDCEVKREAIR